MPIGFGATSPGASLGQLIVDAKATAKKLNSKQYAGCMYKKIEWYTQNYALARMPKGGLPNS